jgi:hypothetical protein
MEAARIGILALSGLAPFAIGAARLSNPIPAFQKLGIKLPQDPSTLNEMRGQSALTLFGGLMILSGAVSSSMTSTSHVTAIWTFGGAALGRCVSLVVDGKPHAKMMPGFYFEILFCALNLVALMTLS